MGSVRQLAGMAVADATDLERIETELSEARRYVSEAERLVADLAPRSHSAALARELLATFEANLAAFRGHLRLVAEERNACGTP